MSSTQDLKRPFQKGNEIMLQYQSGDYCICIWDNDKTELANALESLVHYIDDKGKQNDMTFMVEARAADDSTDFDKAKAILEKASMVISALQYEGRESEYTLYEIAETVTACIYLAKSLGYDSNAFQQQLDLVGERNTRKGH